MCVGADSCILNFVSLRRLKKKKRVLLPLCAHMEMLLVRHVSSELLQQAGDCSIHTSRWSLPTTITAPTTWNCLRGRTSTWTPLLPPALSTGRGSPPSAARGVATETDWPPLSISFHPAPTPPLSDGRTEFQGLVLLPGV